MLLIHESSVYPSRCRPIWLTLQLLAPLYYARRHDITIRRSQLVRRECHLSLGRHHLSSFLTVLNTSFPPFHGLRLPYPPTCEVAHLPPSSLLPFICRIPHLLHIHSCAPSDSLPALAHSIVGRPTQYVHQSSTTTQYIESPRLSRRRITRWRTER
jgi:hypothetical protein